MKRSAMISLAAVAAAGVALPARAQGSAVRLGIVGVEEAALPYYAQQKGFFKNAGVDVTMSVLPNGGSVTQAILGGSLDIGVTNSGSMSSAYIHNLPLQMLACGAVYAPRSPISHLAVGKESGIKTGKELNGKTIAVSTLHDMIQATVLDWIEQNGGDWHSMKFVEMPPPQMAAAIVAKRIDGAAIVEPFFAASKNDLFDLGHNYAAVNHDKPFQTLGLAVSKDYFAKDAAAAKKVASAIHEAAKWANDSKNYDEAAKLLTAFTKVEPAVIAAYPRLSFADSNSPGLIQPVVDMMAKYQFIERGFNAAALFAPGMA